MEYIYYTIQFRTTHSTRNIKIKNIPAVKELDKWSGCGMNGYFSRGMQPWSGNGNDYKPIDRAAYNNSDKVHQLTGESGWFDIKFALKALKRLRALDLEGEFDYIDGYSRKTNQCRHEFRIVQVVHRHEVTAITLKDLLEEQMKRLSC